MSDALQGPGPRGMAEQVRHRMTQMAATLDATVAQASVAPAGAPVVPATTPYAVDPELLAAIAAAGTPRVESSADASPADAPVADAPVADAPVADAPVADAPVADAPVADAPVADAPVAEGLWPWEYVAPPRPAPTDDLAPSTDEGQPETEAPELGGPYALVRHSASAATDEVLEPTAWERARATGGQDAEVPRSAAAGRRPATQAAAHLGRTLQRWREQLGAGRGPGFIRPGGRATAPAIARAWRWGGEVALMLIVASGAAVAVRRVADGRLPAPQPIRPARVVLAPVARASRPAATTGNGAGPTPPPSRAPAAPVDWADSLEVPSELLQGDPGVLLGPLARAGSSVPRARVGPEPVWTGGSNRAPAEAPRAPAAPLAAPALVRRVAGDRVALYALGGAAVAPTTSWSVPGACTSHIRADEGAGRMRTGREVSGMGSWIYTLAMPEADCSAARERMVARTTPGAADRQRLAEAARALVPGAGWDGNDLRDLAVGRVGSTRYAWGVFRRSLATTQVYPPPPLPQLAFVARQDGDRWTMAWSAYVGSSAEVIALAGVYDVSGAGSPQAFFVRRGNSGVQQLLQIGDPGTGTWGIVQAQGL